jgi:hypothetical protein
MKFLFGLFFFVSPVFAYAGESEGLVTHPLVGELGIFMFSAGPHLDKPACSTVGEDWALNATTSGGKSMQAIVLTAYSLGKKLHVVGKGVCDAWGDRETPAYLLIVD